MQFFLNFTIALFSTIGLLVLLTNLRNYARHVVLTWCKKYLQMDLSKNAEVRLDNMEKRINELRMLITGQN